MTREDVLEKLQTVEHPEIAVSLVDLGMIIDVALDGNTAKLAIAFPMANIPQAVVDAIMNAAGAALKEIDLEMQTDGVHFVGASYKAWAKALVAQGAPLAPLIAHKTQATA